MANYFFHRDNKQKNKSVKIEFLNLLDKPLYKNAINDVRKEYLSLYQRLILKCAIKKNYLCLKLLRKIKIIIKSMI